MITHTGEHGVSGWSRASGPLTIVFTLMVLIVASRGVQLRNEYYIVADNGLGYALGIVGATMMLLLLLYPLRKNLGFMRDWGAVSHWFRVHMILGILGPLCILFHCNFSLGATNSNVALVCMALMVSSGMVGRFIYARIHSGLYGHKLNLAELQGEQMDSAARLGKDATRHGSALDPDSMAALRALQHYALARPTPLMALPRLLSLSLRSRVLGMRLRRRIRTQVAESEVAAVLLAHVREHLELVRRIGGFAFFERLFSLWHALHMPIFVMLLITGIVHVWAVHHY